MDCRLSWIADIGARTRQSVVIGRARRVPVGLYAARAAGLTEPFVSATACRWRAGVTIPHAGGSDIDSRDILYYFSF
jgi:hypothetical protein